MQQLSLQFEGYADTQQHIDVGTTKRCNGQSESFLTRNSVFPTEKLCIPRQGIISALREAKASLVLSAQAALAITFGFTLMFFAAIIGG